MWKSWIKWQPSDSRQDQMAWLRACCGVHILSHRSKNWIHWQVAWHNLQRPATPRRFLWPFQNNQTFHICSAPMGLIKGWTLRSLTCAVILSVPAVCMKARWSLANLHHNYVGVEKSVTLPQPGVNPSPLNFQSSTLASWPQTCNISYYVLSMFFTVSEGPCSDCRK